MRTTRELLGARIKELRKNRKLTQEQLSEKINIDPKHLSRIEVGKSYPSLDTLENISKALNVEMKDLFEFVHLQRGRTIADNLKELLNEASEDKQRLILKIIRAAVR